MSGWIGIGLFCGGLGWTLLALLVATAPMRWDAPGLTVLVQQFPTYWPIFAVIASLFIISGLGVIRRARINGAVHGSR